MPLPETPAARAASLADARKRGNHTAKALGAPAGGGTSPYATAKWLTSWRANAHQADNLNEEDAKTVHDFLQHFSESKVLERLQNMYIPGAVTSRCLHMHSKESSHGLHQGIARRRPPCKPVVDHMHSLQWV